MPCSAAVPQARTSAGSLSFRPTPDASAQRAATGGYDVLAACDEGQFDYDDSGQGNRASSSRSLLPNLKPGGDGQEGVAAATVQTVHRKSKRP